jgi:hypothetical protein
MAYLREISLFGAAVLALQTAFATAPAAACGTPLTVQDIQSGVMPSDDNMPCRSGNGSSSSSGPSAAEQQAARARVQAQNSRYRRAASFIAEANHAADSGDTARSIDLYREAIDLLRANGDQKNVAIAQRDLAIATKEYAAVKDDNRVAEARAKYANQDIYQNKSNPFAAQRNQQTTSAKSYDPRSNCSTITGPGMTGGGPCDSGGTTKFIPEPSLKSGGKAQTVSRPQIWRPGSIAPDIQAEIMSLADTLMDMSSGKPGNDNDARQRIAHALERRLADHPTAIGGSKAISAVTACLQPVGGSDQKLLDVPLRWRPHDIKKEAIDRSHLCDAYAEGAAKDYCRDQKYGEAVMWAEPELAGQCRAAEMPNQDPSRVAECAKNKFLNAWGRNGGIVAAPRPNNWVMPAYCNASNRPESDKKSLRALLKERLEAAQRAADTDEVVEPPAAAAYTVENEAPEPTPSPTDDDEAYCNYMARSAVRGELTQSDVTAIPLGCKATIVAAEVLRSKRHAAGQGAMSLDTAETDQEIMRLKTQ